VLISGRSRFRQFFGLANREHKGLGNKLVGAKKMTNDNYIEEIEPGVVALGAAYAATLISLIFWLAA